MTLAVEFNDEQRQESAERAAAAAVEPADEPLPEAGESLQAETPAPRKKNADKQKRYTKEEKTEIAMMYAAGEDVSRIAEKFGRGPKAILSQVGKMHVKRGHNPTDPEQADASKQVSVLEKPWCLKKVR